ncbi:hypothetical protein [Ralstonia sp. NFACC01]|uniref:hypothetical protein n=1 Tax=Ralstonia sp. NFACC01 TaxID=1566294 RepID=UPI0015871716|nr:hypothetical protein [Ralstonia sp. NFACC01]
MLCSLQRGLCIIRVSLCRVLRHLVAQRPLEIGQCPARRALQVGQRCRIAGEFRRLGWQDDILARRRLLLRLSVGHLGIRLGQLVLCLVECRVVGRCLGATQAGGQVAIAVQHGLRRIHAGLRSLLMLLRQCDIGVGSAGADIRGGALVRSQQIKRHGGVTRGRRLRQHRLHGLMAGVAQLLTQLRCGRCHACPTERIDQARSCGAIGRVIGNAPHAVDHGALQARQRSVGARQLAVLLVDRCPIAFGGAVIGNGLIAILCAGGNVGLGKRQRERGCRKGRTQVAHRQRQRVGHRATMLCGTGHERGHRQVQIGIRLLHRLLCAQHIDGFRRRGARLHLRTHAIDQRCIGCMQPREVGLTGCRLNRTLQQLARLIDHFRVQHMRVGNLPGGTIDEIGGLLRLRICAGGLLCLLSRLRRNGSHRHLFSRCQRIARLRGMHGVLQATALGHSALHLGSQGSGRRRRRFWRTRHDKAVGAIGKHGDTRQRKWPRRETHPWPAALSQARARSSPTALRKFGVRRACQPRKPVGRSHSFAAWRAAHALRIHVVPTGCSDSYARPSFLTARALCDGLRLCAASSNSSSWPSPSWPLHWRCRR